MRITQILRTAALSLVAASGLAMTAHATEPAPNPVRADLLFARATAMEEQAATTSNFPRHLRRTAHLYLSSAELRADSDPRKIESLSRAGALLVRVDPDRACTMLGRAASLALSHGDVVRTAHLYLDAAWVLHAREGSSMEDRARVNDFLRKARLLADAPRLGAHDRDGIMKRIRSPETLATR
jgi:hypothetical protein